MTYTYDNEHISDVTIKLICDVPWAKRKDIVAIIDDLAANDTKYYEAYVKETMGQSGVEWNEDTRSGFHMALYMLRDNIDHQVMKAKFENGEIKRPRR